MRQSIHPQGLAWGPVAGTLMPPFETVPSPRQSRASNLTGSPQVHSSLLGWALPEHMRERRSSVTLLLWDVWAGLN